MCSTRGPQCRIILPYIRPWASPGLNTDITKTHTHQLSRPNTVCWTVTSETNIITTDLKHNKPQSRMAQQQSWDSFYEEWSTLPDPGQAPATSGQSTYTASPYPTSRDPYGGQSYQTTSSGYYQEGNPYQQGNYDYTSTMIPATSEDSNDEGDYVSSPPSYGYQSQQSPTMASTGYLSSSGGYQQPYNGLSSMTTPTNNYSMASPSRSYSTSSQSAPYDCEHCGKRFEKRHLLK